MIYSKQGKHRENGRSRTQEEWDGKNEVEGGSLGTKWGVA